MYTQRMHNVQRRLESLVDSLNTIPKVTSERVEQLRLFVTPMFVPTSDCSGTGEKDRPHFLLRFDGVVFDLGDARNTTFSLSPFLDSVVVTVFADRKQTLLQTYTWSAANSPFGLSADYVLLKIASEKSCSCRVELKFSDRVSSKYALSAYLREYLQTKYNELSRSDIYDALLHQIAHRNLFLDKDSRMFKIDEFLQPILGEDLFCKVSDLWIKLLEGGSIVRAETMEFDLALNSSVNASSIQTAVQSLASTSFLSLFSDTDVALQSPSQNSPGISSIWRSFGGRCFDLEVRRVTTNEPYMSRLSLARMQATGSKFNCEERSRSRALALKFLRRELREDSFLVHVLGDKNQSMHTPSATNHCDEFPKPPIITELIAKRRRLSSNVEAAAEKRFQPFRTEQSAAHNFSTFVNLGEDSVFHSSRRWIVDSYGLQSLPSNNTTSS